MKTAAELAGRAAGDAICMLAEGMALQPVLCYRKKSASSVITSFLGDDGRAAVERGRQRLGAPALTADHAVLLYGARIPVDGEPLDAAVMELRDSASPGAEAVFVLPYRPATPGPFRIHRPKVATWDGCSGLDMDDVMDAFFDGLAGQEAAAAIWNACFDDAPAQGSRSDTPSGSAT